MAKVISEDEHAYTVEHDGKRRRVAKTPGTKKQFGRGESRAEVNTATDFDAWDEKTKKAHDEALEFLEIARQPTAEGAARRELLMKSGGLSPAKASQMAAYRAWRHGLDKPGGDDKRLRASGLNDEQIAAARKETQDANRKMLGSVFDIFVPKSDPKKGIEMPAEEVHGAPKPKRAPAAAAHIEGAAPPSPPPAAANPQQSPPPVQQAPSPVSAIPGDGQPPIAAPVAPVSPIVGPQPVMTIQGQPVPTDQVLPNPDEERQRLALAGVQ